MKILYRRCAGMDVHKKSISVCVRRRHDKKEEEIEEAVVGTFTQELERLAEWLKEHKVRQVAMDSTGVYPVWNVLESPQYGLQFGRAILELLAAGSTNPERLAGKALGHLRIKMPN